MRPIFRVLLAAAIALGACKKDDGIKKDGTPGLSVSARSGAPFDLLGTTWTACNPNDPQAGQSYAHAWSFGTSAATIVHDVHTASTDCTGATDTGQHFDVTMTFAVGPSRNAGWDDPAPSGQPDPVLATSVTFSLSGGLTFPSGVASLDGLAYVDDTGAAPVLFITNPGDVTDPDAVPTTLPSFVAGTLE
jgi:hypothetical protein